MKLELMADAAMNGFGRYGAQPPGLAWRAALSAALSRLAALLKLSDMRVSDIA